jgi:hypothetical protein
MTRTSIKTIPSRAAASTLAAASTYATLAAGAYQDLEEAGSISWSRLVS